MSHTLNSSMTGRVTAVGSHSELLAESEHYRFVISSLEENAADAAASGTNDQDPARTEAAEVNQ